jgi:hypothetical protein
MDGVDVCVAVPAVPVRGEHGWDARGRRARARNRTPRLCPVHLGADHGAHAGVAWGPSAGAAGQVDGAVAVIDGQDLPAPIGEDQSPGWMG